jgi:hypothetical protein
MLADLDGNVSLEEIQGDGIIANKTLQFSLHIHILKTLINNK